MFTNFTGQHRKTRTINLGGRNSSGPNSRESTLRRAQFEREKRERHRREEVAALTIQSYFRGRREVSKAREQFEIDWLDSVGVVHDSQSKQLTVGELNNCFIQFAFFFRQRYSGSEKNQLELSHLLDIIRTHELSTVSRYCLSSLFSSILVVFQKHLNSASGCQIKALEISIALKGYLSKDIIPVLSLYTSSLASSNQEVKVLLVQTVQALAAQFPLEYLRHFLSTPNLHLVSNELLQLPITTLQDLIQEIIKNPSTKTASSPSTQAWQFANFLTLISPLPPSLDLLTAIYKVISTLNVSIVSGRSQSDLPGDSDSDEDYLSRRNRQQEQTQNNTVQFKTNNQYLLTTIWNLYKQAFVNSVMDILLPVIEQQSDFLASLFVSLARLCPSKKQDLMLYISLVPVSKIPGNMPVVLSLWVTLKRSSLYQQGSTSTLSTTQIDLFAQNHLGSLTQLVFIFELFSYWLIVTDDSEFHGTVSDGELSLGEIINLSTFLKNFAYSLIWNWPTISVLTSLDSSFLTFDKIKSISVLLLRQIYIRDSRRQFLEKGFWLMTSNFDMELFIPAVVEEEERRRELEQQQADSDSDEEPMKAKSSRNRPGMSGSSLSLRLELLRQVPFFMPFDVRVKIFQAFVSLDRERSYREGMSIGGMFNMFGQLSKNQAKIRRTHLLEDAFEGFDKLGRNFKNPIGVTFFNDYGPEVGIDGGGITKEFLTSVCQEAFKPSPDDEFSMSGNKNGLFSVNTAQLLYPNPIFGVGSKYTNLSPEERREGLQYIKFLGKMIGKCLYEEILVDVEFALFFLQKWTGMTRNSFDDMFSLDPEVYNNLVKVHNYPGDVENDLSLDFTITQAVGHGKQATIPLLEGGTRRPVTNNNRLEYIHAVANYKLNSVLQAQTAAFLQGMSELISLNWLSMFNGPELQMLISGGSAKIDLQDLKDNSVMLEFNESDATMKYFWEVLEEFSDEDKYRFIKFVTSVPKAPLLGFSVLRPKFAIRNAGNDLDRLPTSSTCVNLIKLPNYRNKKLLREKLLTSIRADAGFDLS